ncbi:MAG: decaprenyl-phosphate phosphoribosyltransferase [Candidatus Edwardsbacteria bacterium]
MKTFILIWESFRSKQWMKNLFIFAGILFSQNILDFLLLSKVIFAFLIFCFLSGSIYIFNDLTDLEQDRRHPVKSHRPLASGRLKAGQAISALIIFIPSSLAVSYWLNLSFFIIALAYFLLQLAYSFSLKNVVILDVFIVAIGFVLRVLAGAVVINVEISSWFLVCAILLSLFLGLSKRRYELVVLKEKAQNYRKVLAEYSPYLLDQMISVVTSATVVAYTLYTVSPETIQKFKTKNLIFTVPFVLYGIFRYLYLIHQKGLGGNPENILVTDKPLMIDILLWVITAGIILYG